MTFPNWKQTIAVLSFCAVFALAALWALADADVSTRQFTLNSPYDFGEYQHKVQLHTHTTNSDGDHAGEWVMQAYEELGYAAVAITDHDYTRFSATLEDPGGHNIIFIPGVEYSGNDRERSWNHLLGINISTIHHADGTGARQAQIDQATREGGLTYLCHPYSENVHRRGWNEEDVLELVSGYTGIEIHNGGSYHEPGGRDYPYKVDLALMSGIRVWVISVDDFHRNPETALHRGCVVINSNRDGRSLRREDVVAALASGNYFAAGRLDTAHPEPPRFTNITVDGHTITVKTDKETDIEFITSRANYYLEGANHVQKTEGVTTAQYTATHEDGFVRIKASYTEGGSTSYAWSNPIFIED